jgi:hypothetical protein
MFVFPSTFSPLKFSIGYSCTIRHRHCFGKLSALLDRQVAIPYNQLGAGQYIVSPQANKQKDA